MNSYSNSKARRRKRLPFLRSYKRIHEYGDMCPICHRCGIEEKDMQIHHVVAIVNGGGSPPWNLLRICRTCHAVLENGNGDEAIELRIRAHWIQVARYGLLYALYLRRFHDGVSPLINETNKHLSFREMDRILKAAVGAAA